MKTVEKLRLLLINATSIMQIDKKLEIEALVTFNNYDIICVTESSASPCISDSELKIEGYTMYRRDRSSVSDNRDGGVLIYVKEVYNTSENNTGTLNSIKCEALWIKIIMGVNCFINLGVCYHSPNASSEEVENMFSSIKEAPLLEILIFLVLIGIHLRERIYMRNCL